MLLYGPTLIPGSGPSTHAATLIQRCDTAAQVRGSEADKLIQCLPPLTNRSRGPRNNTHHLMVGRPPAEAHKESKGKQI